MELQLAGKTFGYWDVLEKDVTLSEQSHMSYWKCKCQLCGNIYSVRGTALNTGKSTKCQHCSSRVINEIGNKYGKLTVIESAGRKNNRAMWRCKCECGNIIETNGTDLRGGKVNSCGRCPNVQSIGETLIKEFLVNGRIEFVQEHRFGNLFYENGYQPRFDFYIPSRNYIIEYDGEQHFRYDAQSSWNTKEHYEKTISNDRIKNQYCFDYNIPIIRIPYTAKKDLTIYDLIPETSRFILRKDEENV